MAADAQPPERPEDVIRDRLVSLRVQGIFGSNHYLVDDGLAALAALVAAKEAAERRAVTAEDARSHLSNVASHSQKRSGESPTLSFRLQSGLLSLTGRRVSTPGHLRWRGLLSRG